MSWHEELATSLKYLSSDDFFSMCAAIVTLTHLFKMELEGLTRQEVRELEQWTSNLQPDEKVDSIALITPIPSSKLEIFSQAAHNWIISGGQPSNQTSFKQFFENY